jgi:hypothetical protein
VAGGQQALDQHFSEKAGATNHQYILLHGVSPTNAVYFVLYGAIVQTINIDSMAKKN